MTVAELIEHLSRFPQNADVVIFDARRRDGDPVHVEEVKITIVQRSPDGRDFEELVFDCDRSRRLRVGGWTDAEVVEIS